METIVSENTAKSTAPPLESEPMEVYTFTDKRGSFDFELPKGLSNEDVNNEFGKLDLDLMLGLEQVNETEVGETQVEKLKEFENSAGAGRKGGKWYGHESLEGGTQTIAYGHKLTPEEAKSGFISINGELVDYREGLSQDHAEAVLKADTQWAQTHASASLKKIGMEEDEGKLQAITSLIYNVGSGSWGSSKAKKFLEAGNIEDFMHEAFSEEAGFVNINGEYSRGLARRRKEEAGLFAQANINEGSPFSKMISEVLNTINPISTAQAADDPKGLPLPTQAESDAATAAAEPPREATGAPVDLTTPLNTPEATGDPVDLTTPLNQPQVQPQEQGNFGTPPVKPTPPRKPPIIKSSAAPTSKEEVDEVVTHFIPAEYRMFASDILGISDENLGKSYFSKGEQAAHKNIIGRAIKRTMLAQGDDTKQGRVDYDTDYQKGQSGVSSGSWQIFGNDEDSIQKTLGDMKWVINDEGRVIVTDTYDFNDALPESATLSERLLHVSKWAGKTATGDTALYGFLRNGVARAFGSRPGQGSNFSFDLGPVSELLKL